MKRVLPDRDPGLGSAGEAGTLFALEDDAAPEMEPPAGSQPAPGEATTPSFTIEAGRGLILDANAAGWSVWGLDELPPPGPVTVDRAMPALQHLSRLACARQVSSAEVLTFWTAAGVRRFLCHVRRAQAGRSVFVVRVLENAGGRDAAVAGEEPRAGRKEVTATAKLAHEMRTPLSAVIAYAEVLKDEHFGPLGNARYREYARNIFDSARHALGVVDGMLASSPTQSGVPELAFADLDPALIVENCLAVARPLAEQAGLELAAEFAPRMPRIVADEVSLKQMLLNLLTNAIKFARPGDRITVDVAYELGGPLRIAVADTGPGMEEPPLALEGGSVANGRSKLARNAGLGIGLPLTRALAEANGAALVIDSAPGRGTRVTIAFGKDRVVPV